MQMTAWGTTAITNRGWLPGNRMEK